MESATDLKLFCTLLHDSHGTNAVSRVCDDLLLLSLAMLFSVGAGEIGGSAEPLVNLWLGVELDGTCVTPWWYLDSSSVSS